MALFPEISFRNMDSSAAVEERIRARIRELEQLEPRITSCGIVVERAHRRHHRGNVFGIHVVLHVPGREIVVSIPRPTMLMRTSMSRSATCSTPLAGNWRTTSAASGATLNTTTAPTRAASPSLWPSRIMGSSKQQMAMRLISIATASSALSSLRSQSVITSATSTTQAKVPKAHRPAVSPRSENTTHLRPGKRGLLRAGSYAVFAVHR